MPWNSGIPQPAQAISATTGDIQGNFLAVQTWTNVDHVQIDGLLGAEGKHNKVTLMNQAVVPPFTPNIAPATGVSALGLYALAGPLPAGSNPANTTTQLYAHVVRKGAGVNYTTSEIPFSYSVLTQQQTPSNTAFGYTYLPSGIIMKWGRSPANAIRPVAPFDNLSYVVVDANFAGTGPTFTKILSVQLTPKAADFIVYVDNPNTYNNVISVTNITNTTFTIQRNDGGTNSISATVQVYWLCIGY
jgi:hypothetical protein